MKTMIDKYLRVLRDLAGETWAIPALCAVLLIAFTTFSVVWLTSQHQTVKVEIVVPGYKQAP